MSKSKEVYTYGFSKDRKWPEGVYPVPLDASGNEAIEWPSGPIVVSFSKSAAFVRQVANEKPGSLITAVLLPKDRWTPPERHIPYFNRKIWDGDESALVAFVHETTSKL